MWAIAGICGRASPKKITVKGGKFKIRLPRQKSSNPSLRGVSPRVSRRSPAKAEATRQSRLPKALGSKKLPRSLSLPAKKRLLAEALPNPSFPRKRESRMRRKRQEERWIPAFAGMTVWCAEELFLAETSRCTGYGLTMTGFVEAKTQDSKPETRNPKPETPERR